jgi:antitoxin component YwqK of YwqJK toxin-antitoxin module
MINNDSLHYLYRQNNNLNSMNIIIKFHEKLILKTYKSVNDIPPQSTNCVTNNTMLKLHERNIFTNQVIYRKLHYNAQTTHKYLLQKEKKRAKSLLHKIKVLNTIKSAVLTKNGIMMKILLIHIYKRLACHLD